MVMKAGTKALVIDPKDNVATALEDLGAGNAVVLSIKDLEKEIVLRNDIPVGHKFATTEIAGGDDVIKYGEVIGQSFERIAAGDHVHIHNVTSPGKKRKKET